MAPARHRNGGWRDPEGMAATLRALAHPTRVRALAELRKSDLSPVELARLLGEPRATLGALAYHVRAMAVTGLVELCETIPRRGAIEHRYTLTPYGRHVADSLDGVPPAPDGRRRAAGRRVA